MMTQATEPKVDPPVEGIVEPKETPPETDWKAEAEKSKAELARLEQRARSAEGRLRENPAIAKVQSDLRELRRLIVESSNLEPEAKQEALGKLTEEQQAEDDDKSLTALKTREANRIGRRLTNAKLTLEHPKVKEFSDQWASLKTRDEVEDFVSEVSDWIEEERDRQRTKAESDRTAAAEKARKEASEKAGTLAIGAGGGTPAAGIASKNW